MAFESDEAKTLDTTTYPFRRVRITSPIGKIEARTLVDGPLTLCRFRFEQDSIVERDKNQISIEEFDEFALTYVNHGCITVEISNYTFDVPQTHGYIADLTSPARVRVSAHSDLTVVFFPRPWLAARVAGIHQTVAKVIDAREGWGIPLAATFGCIANDPPGHITVPPHVLMEHIASAFALAVGEDEARLTGARALTYRRLRRALAMELHDPDLTPASFARRHGLSVRTLHALFAASGSSFGDTLMHFRLAKARRMLEDPSFDAMSIAEIGFLAGFANASHFGRRFRQEFHHSPAAWREARRNGAMTA